MGFVNEQNDRARQRLDLVNDPLQATLELAFDTGTCLEQAHIKRQQFDIFQWIRNFTPNDSQRQPFDNCSFANTRLAHHNRIVLAAASQYVDHLPQAVVPTQHRIKRPLPGLLRQVMSEAFEQ